MLKKWHRNMNFSKGKCRELCLEWNNPVHQFLVGTPESTLQKVVDKLNLSPYCPLLAKVSSVLDCIRKDMATAAELCPVSCSMVQRSVLNTRVNPRKSFKDGHGGYYCYLELSDGRV